MFFISFDSGFAGKLEPHGPLRKKANGCFSTVDSCRTTGHNLDPRAACCGDRVHHEEALGFQRAPRKKQMSNQTTSQPSKAASGKAPPAVDANKDLDEGLPKSAQTGSCSTRTRGAPGSSPGICSNELEMPEIERAGQKQEWKCLLIFTTTPCKGIGRDKNVVDVPAGSEVLIPGTFKVEDAFAKAAVSPPGATRSRSSPSARPRSTRARRSGSTRWATRRIP